jgi:hypothetical protein
MPEEIGNPFAILHVCFATGKRFDMLRVDQQERAPFFENVVDGMPECQHLWYVLGVTSKFR